LNLGHLDFDIVSTARCPVENFELRISDFANLGIFTTVKSPLQIDPFMQNKANFRKAQMNVNSFITKDYRKKDDFAVQKNKPNTNPNKANTKPIKANKMPKQTQYKPNTNPIPQRDTQYAIRDTRYKPNQTQFQSQKNAAAFDD